MQKYSGYLVLVLSVFCFGFGGLINALSPPSFQDIACPELVFQNYPWSASYRISPGKKLNIQKGIPIVENEKYSIPDICLSDFKRDPSLIDKLEVADKTGDATIIKLWNENWYHTQTWLRVLYIGLGLLTICLILWSFKKKKTSTISDK